MNQHRGTLSKPDTAEHVEDLGGSQVPNLEMLTVDMYLFSDRNGNPL